MSDDAVVSQGATGDAGAPMDRAAGEVTEGVGHRGRWVEQMHAAHAREVWAILYAKVCEPELVREAVQEAFLRLHGQSPEVVRDVRAWLVRVGHNWMRDQFRRGQRVIAGGESLDAMPNVDAEPIDTLLSEEQRTIVRSQLACLAEGDRQVLTMRYALDWSSARIAEALGSRVTAVDMRLSRARRRLGDLLRQQGIDFEWDER